MKVIYLLILSLISFSSQNNCKKEIIKFLMRKTNGNKIATAGLMGNLYDKSRYSSMYLKGFDENASKEFTKKMNANGLPVLLQSENGYGLAQWESPMSKKTLFRYANDYFKKMEVNLILVIVQCRLIAFGKI